MTSLTTYFVSKRSECSGAIPTIYKFKGLVQEFSTGLLCLLLIKCVVLLLPNSAFVVIDLDPFLLWRWDSPLESGHTVYNYSILLYPY